MKYRIFDVVRMKDNNKATILGIKNNEYYAEIVDSNGNTIDTKNISENEIRKILVSKDKVI